jgi:hypothetical protein
VEERRGDHVRAADGDVGQLHAVRVDPGSGQLTHLLVREGHVWIRKDVAVPVEAVTGFDGGIRLSLTRQQVKDLPPAETGLPAT